VTSVIAGEWIGIRHVLHSHFRRELFDCCAKHPVEGWERMNDVGERVERRPQLDGEHELALDLAGTRTSVTTSDGGALRRMLARSAVVYQTLVSVFGSRAAVP
jgi:hypothetical protein